MRGGAIRGDEGTGEGNVNTSVSGQPMIRRVGSISLTLNGGHGYCRSIRMAESVKELCLDNGAFAG